MRLWKALHTLYRGKKGLRRANVPRARPEVEALDQRLLPSSVPNLAGVGMHFAPVSPYTNTSTSLTIKSVQDLGGGKGTFVGVYQDTLDGVSTTVSGSMTFKGMAVDPLAKWLPTLTYDFGVTFSGSTQLANSVGYSVSRASGSGDVYVTRVSGNASDYTNIYSSTWAGLSFVGTESDSFFAVNYRTGSSYSLRESGSVCYNDIWLAPG